MEFSNKKLKVPYFPAESEGRLGGRVNTVRLSDLDIVDKLKEMEEEEKGGKREEEEGFLELGAQWIHGRGANPLWQFCLQNGLPIRQVNSTKSSYG